MKVNEELKISIITPSFNQGEYLEENIKSVLQQNIDNIEHIIIDGGSTDSTIDVLKKYSHLLWVSEPDEGQADALNKGFEMATGDIIGWINSDDYYQKDVFQSVCKCFSDPVVNWIVGNLTYIDSRSGDCTTIKSKTITYNNLINNPDIVKQPPTFFRKTILEQAGLWNAKYHMVMDYDLWLRLAKHEAPKMVDINYAYFRLHEYQKTSPTNLVLQKNEMIELLTRENAPAFRKIHLRCKKRWYWLKSILKPYFVKSRY